MFPKLIPLISVLRVQEQAFNWPETHQVPDASAYGIGTARAVAKLLGILANGGEPLFKRTSTLELFNQPVRSGPDELGKLNTTYGYGVIHFYSEEDEVSTSNRMILERRRVHERAERIEM